jgi:molecular chaperone GrpE (heat shock protein)
MEPVVPTKSIRELQQIESQEQERQKKLEEDENKRLEQQKKAEQERLETERRQAISASQSNIDSLISKVTSVYYDLCSQKDVHLRKKQELQEAQGNYDTFLLTKDIVYPVKEYDERETVKNKLHRIAYWVLPFADAVFAFFVLSPMFKEKLEANDIENPIIAFVISILLGFVFAIIGRVGKNIYHSKVSKIQEYVLDFALALLVPVLYWIYYWVFGGSIAYIAGFSLASFVIQLLIIKGWPANCDACAYFKDKQENEAREAARDRQDAELEAEVQRLTIELGEQPPYFANKFDHELRPAYDNLEIACRDYKKAYNEEPALTTLGWKTTYVGDAMLQRPEIPLPPIYQDLSVTGADLEALEYMFKELGWDVPLMQHQLLRHLQTPANVENGGSRQEASTHSESNDTDAPNDYDGQTPSPDDSISETEDEMLFDD